MRLLFSKLFFIKNSFRNTIRVSNGLDPDYDQTTCKGYQQMIKVATSRQINNNLSVCIAQAVLSWIDNQTREGHGLYNSHLQPRAHIGLVA